MNDSRRRLFAQADADLKAAGAEASNLLIIVLAAAILCAPLAIGVGVAWAAAAWIGGATGSHFLGWVIGLTTFAGLYRYVWGPQLHNAVRRAAGALMGGK